MKLGTLRVSEAQVQEKLRRVYAACGCKVYWLSQSRASRQTPGLPDLWLMHPVLGREWTHEVKAADGHMSPAQREFAVLRNRCDRVHLVGGYDVAEGWLIQLRLMRIENGLPIISPIRGEA